MKSLTEAVIDKVDSTPNPHATCYRCGAVYACHKDGHCPANPSKDVQKLIVLIRDLNRAWEKDNHLRGYDDQNARHCLAEALGKVNGQAFIVSLEGYSQTDTFLDIGPAHDQWVTGDSQC